MKGFSLLQAAGYLALAASAVLGAAIAPRGCEGDICSRLSLPLMRRQQYPPPAPGSTNFTPTTGVPGGVVISRLPISTLQRDQPDVFNMYILAVESFMKKNPSDFISWFRISGIHGYPYQPFQYPLSSVVNPGMGYCTHHSVVFLPWHRPYLALMEQALNTEACAIANRFTGPDAQRWKDAAKKTRQPYWDWSDAQQQRLPDAVVANTISVTKPGQNGVPTRVNIPNPLLKYVPPQQFVADIGPSTIRDPSASANMALTFTLRRQQTMDLFAITDYNRFQRQLESIHDSVHVTVGGSMGVINYAAFDPVFWLHHTNVDRLMAMYQNIRPNALMTPGPRSPTLALGGDVNDTPTTPMYPFRHPGGIEWTPKDLQSHNSIFQLGYSYPEVQPKPTAKREQAGNTVGSNQTVVLVNSLYAPDNAAAQTRTEWNAVVLVDTAEFQESCKIKIFIASGKNADATDGLVGFAPIFIGQPGSKKVDTRVNATIPLTEALKSQGHGSLEPEDVVPTLKSQLFWAIEKVKSAESIPVESINSLKVAVYSRQGTYAINKLPTKGDATVYGPATEGKPGGWKEGDPPVLNVPAGTDVSDA